MHSEIRIRQLIVLNNLRDFKEKLRTDCNMQNITKYLSEMNQDFKVNANLLNVFFRGAMTRSIAPTCEKILDFYIRRFPVKFSSDLLSNQFNKATFLKILRFEPHRNGIEISASGYRCTAAICSTPNHILIIIAITRKNQTSPAVNN